MAAAAAADQKAGARPLPPRRCSRAEPYRRARTRAPKPPSYDQSNHKRLPPTPDGGVSPAILVQAGGRFFYATAARLLALKFILSMTVSQPRGGWGEARQSRRGRTRPHAGAPGYMTPPPPTRAAPRAPSGGRRRAGHGVAGGGHERHQRGRQRYRKVARQARVHPPQVGLGGEVRQRRRARPPARGPVRSAAPWVLRAGCRRWGGAGPRPSTAAAYAAPGRWALRMEPARDHTMPDRAVLTRPPPSPPHPTPHHTGPH
jgi:hypothetical protein